MLDPLFRLVCAPGVLDDAPQGWVQALLEEGEIALLADDGGLDAIAALAHRLGVATVRVMRVEDTAERQEQTVIAYAQAQPLVWITTAFSDDAARWARERGPMTLLIEAGGPLPDAERKRVERFAVLLGRQAE